MNLKINVCGVFEGRTHTYDLVLCDEETGDIKGSFIFEWEPLYKNDLTNEVLLNRRRLKKSIEDYCTEHNIDGTYTPDEEVKLIFDLGLNAYAEECVK